jgi:hypothetical protein
VAFVVETPGSGGAGLELTTDYESYGTPVEVPPEPVGAPMLEESDLPR